MALNIRNKIIKHALSKLQINIDELRAEDVEFVSDSLSMLINRINKKTKLLWKEEWVTQTFSAESEVLGTDGLNYRCIRNHTSAASNKPVTGADWTTYWVEGGTSGATWVTATSYTTPGNFTVASDTEDITRAFIRQTASDYPVRLVSADEYSKILQKGDKTTLPSVMWLHKLSTPVAYLYPQPEDTDVVLHYHRIVSVVEATTGTSSVDVSNSEVEAVVWMLAGVILLDFPTSDSRASIILSKAAQMEKELIEGNVESSTDDFIEGAY